MIGALARGLVAGMALAVLAACAALPGEAAPAASAAPAPTIDPVTGDAWASGELRVGALSPRSLPSGECGLFLWRRIEDPPLVFFFNSTTGRAAIAIDGTEQSLRRIEVTSSASGARYREQVFATNGGAFSVRVAVHEREDMPDGARIRSAVMRVEDDRGWSAVIGVGGLAACQP